MDGKGWAHDPTSVAPVLMLPTIPVRENWWNSWNDLSSDQWINHEINHSPWFITMITYYVILCVLLLTIFKNPIEKHHCAVGAGLLGDEAGCLPVTRRCPEPLGKPRIWGVQRTSEHSWDICIYNYIYIHLYFSSTFPVVDVACDILTVFFLNGSLWGVSTSCRTTSCWASCLRPGGFDTGGAGGYSFFNETFGVALRVYPWKMLMMLIFPRKIWCMSWHEVSNIEADWNQWYSGCFFLGGRNPDR